jgi:hypothetical protein
MTQTPQVTNPFAPPGEAPPIPVQYIPPSADRTDASGPWNWEAPAAPAPRSPRRRWLFIAGGAFLTHSVMAITAVTALPEKSSDQQPTAVHLAEVDEPELIPVLGYAYQDLSPRDAAGPQEAEDAVHEAVPGVYSPIAAYDVVRAGAADIRLSQMQVSQDVLDSPDFVEEYALAGVAGSMANDEATVSTKTIGQEKVAHGTLQGDTYYAWFHDGVVTIAQGDDAADTLRFVEAYLAEAHN